MLRHLRHAAIACIALLSIASPAQAEPPAKTYIEMLSKEGMVKDIAEIAINSYASAYLWANAVSQTKFGGRLYCQPDKLAMTADQAVSIFTEFVNAEPKMADEPAGFVMLLALSRTFPCS